MGIKRLPAFAESLEDLDLVAAVGLEPTTRGL